MKTRMARSLAATALTVLGANALTVTAAHAAAPVNGCPNGYTLMAVAALAPQGYQVPGKLDDPSSGWKSFGSTGNGDGFICAQEVGNRKTSWGGQLYQFWDNSLPA